MWRIAARLSARSLARAGRFGGLLQQAAKGIAFIAAQTEAGPCVTHVGPGGAGFFVIGEGNADVTVAGEHRASLGPGDFFGEIALLGDDWRTASVLAANQ